MTEAGWTRGRPTKPGWYWWRDCDCPSDPIIVRVVHDGYGLIVYGLEEYSRRLYETRGEWLGPLSPDSYQQGRVAGARDYRDTIIKELDLDNSKQQEFTRTDVILALAHADDALAQQAQDDQLAKGEQ